MAPVAGVVTAALHVVAAMELLPRVEVPLAIVSGIVPEAFCKV